MPVGVLAGAGNSGEFLITIWFNNVLQICTYRYSARISQEMRLVVGGKCFLKCSKGLGDQPQYVVMKNLGRHGVNQGTGTKSNDQRVHTTNCCLQIAWTIETSARSNWFNEGHQEAATPITPPPPRSPVRGLQLLFPVLMILMVWRTILVRVSPNELLVFRLKRSAADEDERQGKAEEEDEAQEEDSRPQLTHAEDGEGTPPDTELSEAVAAAASETVPEAEGYEVSENESRQRRRGLWQQVGENKRVDALDFGVTASNL